MQQSKDDFVNVQAVFFLKKSQQTQGKNYFSKL